MIPLMIKIPLSSSFLPICGNNIFKGSTVKLAKIKLALPLKSRSKSPQIISHLALQLLQMQAYPQVEKELKEIHQISKESMNEVRTIIENLKTRTLVSEFTTVKKMLEIAGIETEIDHQLDTASLTQDLESTASMILLELVTNIIKHAKASKAFLKVERTEKELVLTVRDDGCGFPSLKGDELHTVRDRVLPFSGEVKVISQNSPTEVQVRLPYKERN